MAFSSLFYLAANACGTKTGLLPSLYDNLPCTNGVPDIKSVADVGIIVANVVRILIAGSGSLAVILLLVASIYYITAMGDTGRVKRAKDIIYYTIVGLAVIILSYAIISYLSGGL
jgi:hypothetical protein